VLLPWRRDARLMVRAATDLRGAFGALPRGARCRVVVSSELARYALVPFSDAVVGREANEALAGHVFRRTHGERVDGWRIRVAPAPIGAPRLACALDAALLDALAAAARGRGITLASVEPAFVAGFNAAHGRLPQSCWLAVLEPGRLALGLLVKGRWRHVVAERVGAEADRALARAFAREALLTEDPGAASRLPSWIVRFGADGAAPAEIRPFASPPLAAAA
jgi:hypothetical protein